MTEEFMLLDDIAEEKNAMSIAASCEQPVVATATARALLRRVRRQEAVIEALGDDVRRQRLLRREAELKRDRVYDLNNKVTGQFNALLAENRVLRGGEALVHVPDDDEVAAAPHTQGE